MVLRPLLVVALLAHHDERDLGDGLGEDPDAAPERRVAEGAVGRHGDAGRRAASAELDEVVAHGERAGALVEDPGPAEGELLGRGPGEGAHQARPQRTAARSPRPQTIGPSAGWSSPAP
jgi:hypothetical protein